MAELPSERLRYWFRQQYRLAPTDSRYLEVTDLQIELEWESYRLANPHLFKKEEVYKDPDYDAAEKEAFGEQKRAVYEPEPEAPVSEQEFTEADREAAWQRLAELQRQMREGGGVPDPVPQTDTPPHEEWEDVPVDGGETT